MAKRQYTPEEARERKNARQREYAKKTGYAANIKSQKVNSKRYVLQMTISTDSDIIEKLDNQEYSFLALVKRSALGQVSMTTQLDRRSIQFLRLKNATRLQVLRHLYLHIETIKNKVV